MEQAAKNLPPMSQLTNALCHLASVVSNTQCSSQIIYAAENQVQHWLAKVIDERIEAATGARP